MIIMSKGTITPKNILNKNQKSKITLENILDKASTDNVSDALKNICGKTGVISGIKPLDKNAKIIGPVRTAYTNSSDWGTCIKAISSCKKDEILFINCSDTEHAVWGELASKAAMKQGIKATVINGATRDTKEVLELGFPLFSKDYMSNAGYPMNNGVIGERLSIENNVIVNGDYLMGDYDGVVIIPKEHLDEVLEEVNNILNFEKAITDELLNTDKNLDDILNIK